nr:hypothetical protein HK105_001543 [Polyrhizophydium stewartii]
MAVPSTAEAELVVLREENDHLRETIRQQAVVKQQLQRELNAALREITTLARSSTLAQSFVELKARFVELQAQCAALEEALGRLPPIKIETPKLERLTLSTSIGTSGDGADGDDGKVLSPSSLAADAMAILAAGTAAAQSAAHFEGNVLRVAPSRTSSLAARQQSTSSSSAGTRPDAPHPGPTSGSKSFALKHGQSGGNALAINTSFVPPPPGPPSSTPLPRTPTTVISASASAKRASWHPYTALSRSATSIMTAASASNSSLSSTSSSSPQPGAGLQLIDETVDERTENMVFTRGKHTSVNLPLSQGSQPHSDPDQISASLGSGSDARHGMLDFFRISRRKTVAQPLALFFV